MGYRVERWKYQPIGCTGGIMLVPSANITTNDKKVSEAKKVVYLPFTYQTLAKMLYFDANFMLGVANGQCRKLCVGKNMHGLDVYTFHISFIMSYPICNVHNTYTLLYICKQTYR